MFPIGSAIPIFLFLMFFLWRRSAFPSAENTTPPLPGAPQGDRIAFSRLEGRTFDIYSVRPDGSDERRLTFGSGNKEHPRWSPDGRFLVYSSDESGKKAIYIMRADGSGQRRISTLGGNCLHPGMVAPLVMICL